MTGSSRNDSIPPSHEFQGPLRPGGSKSLSRRVNRGGLQSRRVRDGSSQEPKPTLDRFDTGGRGSVGTLGGRGLRYGSDYKSCPMGNRRLPLSQNVVVIPLKQEVTYRTQLSPSWTRTTKEGNSEGLVNRRSVGVVGTFRVAGT